MIGAYSLTAHASVYKCAFELWLFISAYSLLFFSDKVQFALLSHLCLRLLGLIGILIMLGSLPHRQCSSVDQDGRPMSIRGGVNAYIHLPRQPGSDASVSRRECRASCTSTPLHDVSINGYNPDALGTILIIVSQTGSGKKQGMASGWHANKPSPSTKRGDRT